MRVEARTSGLLPLSVALIAAFSPGSVLAAQQTVLTDIIIEMSIAGGPSVVVPALAHDSTMMVPLVKFLELAEIRIASVDSAGVRATIDPGEQVLSFSPVSHVVRRGDSVRVSVAQTMVWRDNELYVNADLAAWATSTLPMVDWTTLTVAFGNTKHLPVIKRLLREGRRAALVRRKRPRSLPRFLSPKRKIADGAVLDWSFTSDTRQPFETSVLELGFGARVFDGSLDIQHIRQQASGTSNGDTRASWIRAWPDNDRIRQLRLGEVRGTGRNSREIRGLAVTNAPFVRSVEFGPETLEGSVPPSWELELYRSGRLIDYSNAGPSGRYHFDIPVRYGPNPVDVIAFGPHGERRELRRTFQIPLARLPARRFEYAAAAGECVEEICDGAFNLDLRYGITRRLTFQLGQDIFLRDTLSNLWQPYAGIFASATRSILFSAEWVHRALFAAQADYVPTPDLSLSARQTFFSHSVTAPIVGSGFIDRSSVLAGFWRPALLGRSLFFIGRANFERGADLDRTLVSLIGTIRFSGIRAIAGLNRLESTGPIATIRRTTYQTGIDAILRGPRPLLRGAFATARLGFEDDDGLSEISAGLGQRFLRDIRVDLDLGWFNRGRGLQITLTVTTSFPSVRATSRNTYSDAQGVRGLQQFEGSVLWNRERSNLRFDNGRSLGRAGLQGIVFLDSNGNGHRDPGEEGVPGVGLRVGAQSVASDSEGVFTVWDLVPFEFALVEIDTLSIGNPLWIPQLVSAVVSPAPNSFRSIEIPLVAGGEVSGRVTFQSGRGVAGVNVLFRNLSGGQDVTVTTFSDGTFYQFGVRPGRYELTIPQAILDRRGWKVEPVEFEVNGREGLNTVEGLAIQIRGTSR